MKKKVISLLCVIVVLTTVCAPAFAAKVEDSPNSTMGWDDEFYVFVCYRNTVNPIVYQVKKGIVVGYNRTTVGEPVTIAQRVLNRIDEAYTSVSCGTGAVDGVFGEKTYAGAFNFQAWCRNKHSINMPIDGIIGEQTWEQMEYWCE